MTLLNATADDRLLSITFVHEKIHDGELIEQLQGELLAAVAGAEGRDVLLDFSAVTFFSSAALGMLMRANKRCKESETDLRLCSLSPNLRMVFKLCNLDRVFQIHENADEARRALSKRAPHRQVDRPTAKAPRSTRQS
jgi:anti-sigma B factor antagonist